MLRPWLRPIAACSAILCARSAVSSGCPLWGHICLIDIAITHQWPCRYLSSHLKAGSALFTLGIGSRVCCQDHQPTKDHQTSDVFSRWLMIFRHSPSGSLRSRRSFSSTFCPALSAVRALSRV